MGKKPFKMLEYLIDNNGNFVKSETLYYDIFGLVESENQDSVVDQVRKDLWKISCIKNSDMKIKNIVLEKMHCLVIHLLCRNRR